jgi:hypothetical protein
MATLKPLKFRRKNHAGEVMEFSALCSVGQDGVFSINIPDELAETAKAMRDPLVSVSQQRVHWRVSARTLEAATRFVNAAIDEHLAVEVKVELVICYAHNVKVAYFENADGSIHPNGYFGNYEGGPGNTWKGKLNGSSDQDDAFSVAFVARAFERTTFIRPNQTKIVFGRPDAAHHDDGPLGRLNGFAGLGRFQPGKATAWVPYTDEAAEFFTKMMLGMCDLARKLEQFIDDKDALQIAIQRGAPLLGMAPQAEGKTS